MRKNFTQPRELTVGIDLGGTKVAVGLVDAKGALLAESILPTVPTDLYELNPLVANDSPSAGQVKRHIAYVVGAIADAVSDVLKAGSFATNDRLLGIGLSSAGPMNLDKGTLNHPANFRGWKVVPLVALVTAQLEKKLDVRTQKNWKNRRLSFQNDAIAAALGEGWTGRARGCSTYVMITVGTGIGTGVILNGKPAQSAGMGSEWGHMIVDCYRLGTDRESIAFREVEGHGSGTWLVQRARKGGFKGASAAELAVAARSGDALALDLFRNAADGLAALLYSLSLGFNPERFVFSGGMMEIKDLFFPQTIELYSSLIKAKNPDFLAQVQVSQLGNKAGIIGAARLPRLGAD